MEHLLTELQAWSRTQDNGDWEPGYGVEIGTLEQPGCYLKINLSGTFLEDKEFRFIKPLDETGVWLDCRVQDKKFVGYGSSHHLDQLLAIFLAWAKHEPDWLLVSDETPAETRWREANELWAALGPEIGPELCRTPGCKHQRIKYSAMCRAHHVKMLRG